LPRACKPLCRASESTIAAERSKGLPAKTFHLIAPTKGLAGQTLGWALGIKGSGRQTLGRARQTFDPAQ